MKQFDVYAMGNSLLDIEFEISHETLQRLEIEKGVMTLIDATRERVLLEELDGIKHVKACGGSAANTAAVISQLGGEVFYSGKVANDEAGEYYYQDLIAKGLKTNILPHDRPQGVTGKCLALITPDAERTMNTYLGITETFSVDALDEQAIANAQYLYIEGFLVTSPTGFKATLAARDIARRNNTKIALTLADPNMTRYFKKELLQIIGDGLDLIFCNAQEVLTFCDCKSIDEAKQMMQSYSKQFVITLSEQGAVLFNGTDFSHVAAYQVTPVDTTGAGDIFAGTFLYGITHGYNFTQAGDMACLAAAKVISKFGPRLNEIEIKNLQQHMQLFKAEL